MLLVLGIPRPADETSRQDLFLILRADALDQGLSALRRNDMIVLRHHVQQRYLDVLQVDALPPTCSVTS
jgi:hypothetical protein